MEPNELKWDHEEYTGLLIAANTALLTFSHQPQG